MDSDPVTDDLVRAAQDGDAAAMQALYAALAPTVLGYLRAKGAEDPEGATSDVFLAVFGRIRQVRGGASGLRKLTFSIAHARMVDQHRARARRPTELPYRAEVDTRTVESAEQTAVTRAATAQVLQVLELLPPDQREVITLRVVADLSVEQVAEIMGRSGGAVKQLQRRGLLAIRQALAERRVTL